MVVATVAPVYVRGMPWMGYALWSGIRIILRMFMILIYQVYMRVAMQS
jgi:hypothetical protein